MHSIRTRITVLNIIAIVVAIFTATLIAGFSISNLGHESSEQSLALLCETGKSNLNYYFKSVEQSVNTISGMIDDNLDEIKESEYATKFVGHVTNAKNIFAEAANHTNGVLTYYYRFDPKITEVTNEKGFWFTNLDGKGFVEHEVTDLTDDHYECRWFYEPKESGNPLWLPPYVTDNLDVYVISYNVPVYSNDKFIGVVGIEISYHTIGEQIKDIKALKTGFAYVVENEHGSIIYHPYMDILGMKEEDRPAIPDEFLQSFKEGKHHVEYTFQGVKKHGYWIELANGMSIVVAVPISEVNETWSTTLLWISIAAVSIVAVFTAITIISTRTITKPLKELATAAEKINNGDYDVKLEYNHKNEIGTLTSAFNKLTGYLGDYIEDLNNLAYGDALTEVNSKNAFDLATKDLQEKIDNKENIEFAVAIFDCDNLKQINDNHGHDKGNVYLKNSSNLICRVFEHSEVYRLGGDEFAVILFDKDFENRESLKNDFLEKSRQITAFAKEPWEELRVSVGVATYDPEVDRTVNDVVVHADHIMYENKRERKKKNKA